jgi:hypothetical protein
VIWKGSGIAAILSRRHARRTGVFLIPKKTGILSESVGAPSQHPIGIFPHPHRRPPGVLFARGARRFSNVGSPVFSGCFDRHWKAKWLGSTIPWWISVEGAESSRIVSTWWRFPVNCHCLAHRLFPVCGRDDPR